MPDLKYQTIEELQQSKIACEQYISKLKNQLGGQDVRLQWINQYIFEKTPQEMTIDQVEAKLGHKIIFKQS